MSTKYPQQTWILQQIDFAGVAGDGAPSKLMSRSTQHAFASKKIAQQKNCCQQKYICFLGKTYKNSTRDGYRI
jgi:hypothetical protein